MKPKEFWTWFQDNQEKLYILPLLSTEEQQDLYHWLETYLDYYYDDIVCELKFSKTYTTPATFVFYTNDDPDMKRAILTLVENAPPMDNWNVVTFNKRKEDLSGDKTVGPANFKLRVNQLYFQPVFKINDDSKITINIFTTKKVSYAKRKQFKKLCIQILIDMVGEETLDQHINFIRCNLKAQVPGVAIKFIHFNQFIKSLKQLYE
ncbi:MAG: hypothetical protein WDZ45_02415 [Flavobacteriaceae bacterium]